MIVPDTSAWVEFFRRTGSAVHLMLRRLLEERADLGVTEQVVLEVLAGARSERDLAELRSQVLGFPILELHGMDDFERAADLYRTCRRGGDTIRKVSDCLIAVPVIRAGAELLHNDSDFDAIARHSDLRIYLTDGNQR